MIFSQNIKTILSEWRLATDKPAGPGCSLLTLSQCLVRIDVLQLFNFIGRELLIPIMKTSESFGNVPEKGQRVHTALNFKYTIRIGACKSVI